MQPDHVRSLQDILLASAQRRACLSAVAALPQRELWIAAGFVRNAVFNALFGASRLAGEADIDVIYLDESDLDPGSERALEAQLAAGCDERWSVKNQARMAQRHGHAAYASIAQAIAFYPETATAVAVRLAQGALEIVAPYGLLDLLSGVMAPTPAHRIGPTFGQRCYEKRWAERWPGLHVAPVGEQTSAI